MDRAEAIRRVVATTSLPEAGEEFVVERFREEDAGGVARLFVEVYGDTYPFDLYYRPGAIAEANARGDLSSVVARTPSGGIVAHGAFYRSAAPNPGLLEVGQLIVPTSYRETFAAFRVMQTLFEKVAPALGIEGVFGEAVCHILASQKVAHVSGMSAVGIEVDQMPAGSYEREGASGRVSCLLLSRTYRDAPGPLSVPAACVDETELVLADLGLSREVTISTGPLPENHPSNVRVEAIPSAGVLRAWVSSAGFDLEERAREIDARADSDGLDVRQLYLSLHGPGTGAAVDILRSEGWFFGGFLPLWFGSDALFLQKVARPRFDGLKLFTPKARRLLELVRASWERTQT